MGHYTNRCPDKDKKKNQGERRTNLVQEDDVDSIREYTQEEGTCLMMKRTLIQETIPVEPTQRRTVFTTNYKIHGKACKLVIDYGPTKNIVSREMVEKLKLEKIKLIISFTNCFFVPSCQTLVPKENLFFHISITNIILSFIKF